MNCPYCNERKCDSDDHIFLQAIGGHRTIPACKICNSLFGRTFEAQAITTILHPILVQLAGVGVPVAVSKAKWRNATTGDDDQLYDAVIDESVYKLESTRPFVRKDEDNPKKFNIRVGDDRVGRKHLRQFLNEDKFRVLSMERNRVDVKESTHNWGFDPAIKLTALKMAFAIGTITFPEEVTAFTVPRRELCAAQLEAEPKSVQSDQRDHAVLDALRPPLSHMIYVEQKGKNIQAFVQFFGALQFWIELSSNALKCREKAVCFTLDPVSGVENWEEVVPLNLVPWTPEILIDPLLPIKKLNAGAANRGAQTQEMIRLRRLILDGVEAFPRFYWMTSWTGDVPKKKS